jgi:hypothetical protein
MSVEPPGWNVEPTELLVANSSGGGVSGSLVRQLLQERPHAAAPELQGSGDTLMQAEQQELDVVLDPAWSYQAPVTHFEAGMRRLQLMMQQQPQGVGTPQQAQQPHVRQPQQPRPRQQLGGFGADGAREGAQ